MGALARATRLATRSSSRTRIAVGVLLVPVLTFAYASLVPESRTSTVRIRVLSGTQDSLVQPRPLPRATLIAYASLARGLDVAVGAAQRTAATPDRPSLLRKARELQREIKVTPDLASHELVLEARSSSSTDAARLANSFADAFLQVQGAQAAQRGAAALAAAERSLARLPRTQAARRRVVATLTRRLQPLLSEKRVQVVRRASAGTNAVLIAAVATVLALLALTAVLFATGVWRLDRPAG